MRRCGDAAIGNRVDNAASGDAAMWRCGDAARQWYLIKGQSNERLTKVLDQDAGATFGGSVVCSVVKVVFLHGMDGVVMLGGFTMG